MHPQEERPGLDASTMEALGDAWRVRVPLEYDPVHPVDVASPGLLDRESDPGDVSERTGVPGGDRSLSRDDLVDVFDLRDADRRLDVRHPEVVAELAVKE